MDQPGGSALREWRARRPSWPNANYLLCVALGIAAIVGSIVLLADGSTPGGPLLLAVGTGFASLGMVFMLIPATLVIETRPRCFVLVGRTRRLEIRPGELISIQCLWPDPSRLLPLLVQARSGRMLLAPRLYDVRTLWSALADASPQALMVDPVPWLWRDSGVSRRFEESQQSAWTIRRGPAGPR